MENDKPLHEYEKVISPSSGKEIDIQKVVERVDFVRGNVYTHNPCFGALLEHLNFIYSFDVPTQATDGTRLIINPEWTDTLTDSEIRFVMIHELLHCVFNHMKRGMSKDKRLSNIAADFEVNGAAHMDRFVTRGQLDRIGGVFSNKYIKDNDLWSFEAIYDDLLHTGFVPDAPVLDMIFPENNQSFDIKRIHTSSEWKDGHKDAMSEINKILNSEYGKISKRLGEMYTPDEISRALIYSADRIASLKGKWIRESKDMVVDDDIDDIQEEYRTYGQGWDYAVWKSINDIKSFTGVLSGEFTKVAYEKISMSMEVPATDATEEQINLPRPPKKSGSSKQTELSKEDIISQQEGANIARKNGYKGDFIKEEEIESIENNWNERVENVAGMEGSKLITRHLLDVKSSNYNWQHELRKLLNCSMNNSMKYNNEWGEKRGLARNSMTLKHKSNNNCMKDIVFLVDCSGSISDNMLSNILSECYSITRKCNIKDITYAYFTTKVELVETNCSRLAGKISDAAVMVLKNAPKGGHITGGTDFKTALEWVNDIGGARCVIMLTDGWDTPVYKPSKVKNLIWCVYDNSSFSSADSSRVIHLNTVK